jgi:glyoxylase-like metal-dependent hydrolase (beta-lactamase superfamily II)
MKMTTEVSLKQITKNTVIGKTVIDGVRNSNAGAIALGDYVIVIDPSPITESAHMFRKAVEEHFDLPIRYLLVTHYHNDHTDGIRAFKDVIISGSEELYKQMKSKSKPFPPELTFSDELIFRNKGSRVEFHYVAGHTICSTIAFFPDEKVIFLGDMLFSGDFPWAGDSTCDPDLWIAFFKRILQYDFLHVVPGHGPLCNKEEIKKQLQLLEELRENTLKAISENTGPSGIKKSSIYKHDRPSREKRTLRHFYDFYSNKKK